MRLDEWQRRLASAVAEPPKVAQPRVVLPRGTRGPAAFRARQRGQVVEQARQQVERDARGRLTS